MKSKSKIIFLFFLIFSIIFATWVFQSSGQRSGTNFTEDFQALDLEERSQIGASWNPPRSKDCAKIIAEIASVTISSDISDPGKLQELIIKNTRYAAAGLFKLAKESKDPMVVVWSFKAATILVKFPQAITNNDQAQVSNLYLQIGNLVKKPPQTCDNTLAEAA